MTFTVQVPPATMLPAENATEVAFAAGANVAAPQPVVLAAGVAATVIAPGLVGKVSLKATPVSAVVGFGFVIVKVSVEVAPTAIGAGEKSFAMLGATTLLTTTLAVLLTKPAPALALPTTPVVLLYVPAVGALTLTLMTQLPFAGTVPPISLTAVLPAAKAAPPASLKVPPQPFVIVVSARVIAPGAVGNTSVKVAPVMSFAPFAAGLLKVIVSVLGPFGITGLGANDLAIVGGVITSKLAVLLAAPAAAPVCVVTTPLLVLA